MAAEAQGAAAQTAAQQAGSFGPRRTVAVTLARPGAGTFDTIVLGGTEVHVPLESDVDGDPFQDDEIWLESMDGSVRRRLRAGDPDVVADEESGVFDYVFRGVPFGVYRVFVTVAAGRVELVRGLVVRRKGVFLDGKRLDAQRAGGAIDALGAESTIADDAPTVPGDFLDQHEDL